MKIINQRVLRYACFGVGLCGLVDPLSAQQTHLAPTDIRQIVQQAFHTLLPPGTSLSRVSIEKRRVLFDHERTMAAFGYSGALTLSYLRIQPPVTAASQRVLNDCDQARRKPCSQLGWRVYVWIEPISMTNSTAVVRGHVLWPERGSTEFVKGSPPTGEAFLTGFYTELHLARLANGKWRVVRTGRTAAGD
ncbi:MAG: hypothetical protein ACR2HZ_01850 [Gemmatimonadaceae bacterium]|jgi:hypothetical protein